MKLLRGCVGIAPKIHADAARANARIYLRTIIGGDSLRRELCRGSAHLVNHHGTPRALRERDLKGRTIGATRGKQRVRKQFRRVKRERVDAEEVHELGNIVGAEWPVSYFFAAGSDHDRMKFIVLPNAVNDQPSPVDRHSIGCLPANDPEWRFVR